LKKKVVREVFLSTALHLSLHLVVHFFDILAQAAFFSATSVCHHHPFYAVGCAK
jgi:hypothetical protein